MCSSLIRNSWLLIQTVIRTITKLASYFVYPYTCTNDPIKDVRDFKTEFNRKYSENHYDFFTGTYGAALAKAKSEIRFLLVYLHSPKHNDTDVFCRDILSSDMVACLLVQYNVLLWGVSVRSLEGKRVSRILRENTYPFMALILSHNHHMEVVHRFEGYENREVFVERLRIVLEQQDNYLLVTRNEIQTLNQNRQLRDEQDREYQDSMATDIERKRKQQEEKEDQLREELELDKIREEAKLKRADTERRKSELVTYFSENQTDGPDSIEIRFKFPNDKPVSNRFLQDHPVSRLYDFVFSSENSPDNFQIAMNLPRKVLDANNGEQTLKNVGITKSCTLFVEDLDT
ncbi:FAS-associated factor 2 [Oopsacas minuta]|uniref:FAS-associated factor 2 n=1 Tax=Oopsacas minuta TaxID=111878 RepID=A0AAV7JTP1_9METZ|nr:FAS-associated factor 2 [Oopsacas minuta]